MPSCTPYIEASPLWSRAPARDENGDPYIDFMMLIPGLKKQNEAGIESCLVKIRDSLSDFEEVVVYVDLNIKLNLLWVSAKPVPGISKHIVLAIQREIPHAKVVASDFNPPDEVNNQQFNWLLSMGRKVRNTLGLSTKQKKLP